MHYVAVVTRELGYSEDDDRDLSSIWWRRGSTVLLARPRHAKHTGTETHGS